MTSAFDYSINKLHTERIMKHSFTKLSCHTYIYTLKNKQKLNEDNQVNF